MTITKIPAALSTTDVLDRVLDKGIVIDAEIRIAVAGIELVTVSALVKIASFETWDRYAASTERRARPRSGTATVPDAIHRVRLRCEDGCTFERRASTVVIREGVLARQRCAVKPRQACAVTVL
jgi:gas vesicle structural protein